MFRTEFAFSKSEDVLLQTLVWIGFLFAKAGWSGSCKSINISRIHSVAPRHSWILARFLPEIKNGVMNYVFCGISLRNHTETNMGIFFAVYLSCLDKYTKNRLKITHLHSWHSCKFVCKVAMTSLRCVLVSCHSNPDMRHVLGMRWNDLSIVQRLQFRSTLKLACVRCQTPRRFRFSA